MPSKMTNGIIITILRDVIWLVEKRGVSCVKWRVDCLHTSSCCMRDEHVCFFWALGSMCSTDLHDCNGVRDIHKLKYEGWPIWHSNRTSIDAFLPGLKHQGDGGTALASDPVVIKQVSKFMNDCMKSMQHTSAFLIAALAPASNNSLSADRFSLATAWCTAENNIRNDSNTIGQCCMLLLTCVAVVVLLIDGCIQCEQGAEGVGTEERARIRHEKKILYIKYY